MIPYAKQKINDEDINEVISALRSEFITQGPRVERFEQNISTYCNSKFSIAVNSASSGLHVACRALGVGPGDFVWTTANSFVASANCVLHCGAKVDFVDINLRDYNICVDILEHKLKTSARRNNLPKVLIVVHFAGFPCEMSNIHHLSIKYGFKIIEDASHAFGASYKGHSIGSCKFSDITVFSFHPVKIITTGEGGACTTNNPMLAEKLKQLRSNGIVRCKDLFEPKPADEIWNYEQVELGFNFRMSDIQAALGISQLSRLGKILKERRDIADRYISGLCELPLKLPQIMKSVKSSWHLFVILLDNEKTVVAQKALTTHMHSNGIKCNLHYIPIYRHPYYQKQGFSYNYCPNAETYFKNCLSLPIYEGLSNEPQMKVVNALAEKLT